MLIVIHNLPSDIRYSDIKSLIQSKCGLQELILDNLVAEGNNKKVTVGLVEESDAAILVRKINGLYLGGQQLYVEDVRQKKASDQPFRSTKNLLSLVEDATRNDNYHSQKAGKFREPDSFRQPDNFQHDYEDQCSPVAANFQQPQMYQETAMVADPMAMNMMMNMAMGGMYYNYMPTMMSAPGMQANAMQGMGASDMRSQNNYMGYDNQTQQHAPVNSPSKVPEARKPQERSRSFGGKRVETKTHDMPRDWGRDDNGRFDDRPRQPSPRRGQRPGEQFANRQPAPRISRWDDSNAEPYATRRRSSSPQPWDTGDSYGQNDNPGFENDFRGRDQPQRNREPAYGQRPSGQDREAFPSNDLGGRIPPRSTNVFDSNVSERSARAPNPVWERRDTRSQWEEPEFQTRDGRDRPRRDEPQPMQPRNDWREQPDDQQSGQYHNQDRNAPRPSRPENRRPDQAPRGPVKRFADRSDNDEPHSKKFAGPKPSYSRNDMPNPEPWRQGPINSQAGPRPGTDWDRGPGPRPGTDWDKGPSSAPRPGPRPNQPWRNPENNAFKPSNQRNPDMPPPRRNALMPSPRQNAPMQPSQRNAPNPQRNAPNPQRNAPNQQRNAPNQQRNPPNPQRNAPNPQRNAPNPQRNAPNPQRNAFNPQRNASNPQSNAHNPQRNQPGGSFSKPPQRNATQQPGQRNVPPFDKNAPRPQGLKRSADQPPPQYTPKGEVNKVKLVNLIKRDQTWRYQAAAHICKDMLKNLEIADMGQRDVIVASLKSSIRSRIEVLMEDQISVPLPEIIVRYRKKYPSEDDEIFFVAVLDQIKEDTYSKHDDKTPGTDAVKEGGVGAPKGKSKEDQKTKAEPSKGTDESKTADVEPAAGSTSPKYPKGHLKVFNRHIHAVKFENSVDDLYELPPLLQKTLDEEADILCDLFMEPCQEPENDEDKPICERISDQAADVFRKTVRLNVTKRLLKIQTNLNVRIFMLDGQPSREELQPFLKQYGIQAFKKSDYKKMYIANCNSFEKYDELCALGSTKIGDVTLAFKPLQVAGPPPARRQGKASQAVMQTIQDYVDLDTDGLSENTKEPSSIEIDDFCDDVDVKGFDEGGKVESKGGNVKSEGENVKSEGENVKSEGGNVVSEGGNVKSEGGNAKSEGGNAKSEGGNVESERENVKDEPETNAEQSSGNIDGIYKEEDLEDY